MTELGAHAFLDGLRAAGLTHVFTLPGTQTLPLLRLVAEQDDVQPVFVRSEQAAAFGAVGYARATGRPAVCLSIPGPGATNMISGVAAAHADALPVVVITPQLDDHLRHRNAVHECDLGALFAPIVKAQLRVADPGRLRAVLGEAARLAAEAPMGPVHIEYPQSLLNAPVTASSAADEADSDPVTPTGLGPIVEALRAARRPVLYVGSEVSLRGADDDVALLAHRFGAPVFADEDARGVLPEEHPLALGSASHATAVTAMGGADFVLALGTRFSEWSTKSWTIAMPTQLAQVGEAPPAAGYSVQLRATGRVDLALRELVARTTGEQRDAEFWWPRRPSRTQVPDHGEPSRLHPAAVADAVSDAVTPDTVITLDGSSSAMWMAERHWVQRPRTFLQSEVFREIGSALLMGIGAAVSQSRPVLVVQGDGGMLFQLGELSTIAQAGLRLTVVIFEDGYYNADRLFQEHVYGGRLSDSAVRNPDYAVVADSFGLRGVRAGSVQDVRHAVREARAIDVATVITVPTIATAAPARLQERFVEWSRRLGSTVPG